MWEWEWVRVWSVLVPIGRKKRSDLLDLEFEAVVDCTEWVLAPELWSSTGEAMCLPAESSLGPGHKKRQEDGTEAVRRTQV